MFEKLQKNSIDIDIVYTTTQSWVLIMEKTTVPEAGEN